MQHSRPYIDLKASQPKVCWGAGRWGTACSIACLPYGDTGREEGNTFHVGHPLHLVAEANAYLVTECSKRGAAARLDVILTRSEDSSSYYAKIPPAVRTEAMYI